MDSMYILMDAIALGCGVYCLYTWLKLKISGKLFKNGLLVPKEKDCSDCSDEQAYIAYILPRLAVVGIATTLYGIFIFINDFTGMAVLPFPYSFIPLVAVLAALVWYAVCNSRANRDYFGM